MDEVKGYVNAQAMLEMLEQYRGCYFPHSTAVDIVNKLAQTDVAEVVHGHWCWEGRFKACSKCGSYVEFTETLGASHWKYCPYCGAKMEVKVEHVDE